MNNNLYTWEQLKSYSIIALHNLIHSANDINAKNMDMILEPLKDLYTKKQVIGAAKRILDNE